MLDDTREGRPRVQHLTLNIVELSASIRRLIRKTFVKFTYLATVVFAFASFSMPNFVYAHSGGLNAQGCHAGSQPYHCHRSQAAPRSPQPRATRSISGDMNCADFRSWQDAQAFYEQAGRGDPHRLDADNDGIACEALR